MKHGSIRAWVIRGIFILNSLLSSAKWVSYLVLSRFGHLVLSRFGRLVTSRARVRAVYLFDFTVSVFLFQLSASFSVVLINNQLCVLYVRVYMRMCVYTCEYVRLCAWACMCVLHVMYFRVRFSCA